MAGSERPMSGWLQPVNLEPYLARFKREGESADQIRKVKGGLSELDSHFTTVHSWVVLGGGLRRQRAGFLCTVLSSPYEIVPRTLQVQAIEPPGRLDTTNVEG